MSDVFRAAAAFGTTHTSVANRRLERRDPARSPQPRPVPFDPARPRRLVLTSRFPPRSLFPQKLRPTSPLRASLIPPKMASITQMSMATPKALPRQQLRSGAKPAVKAAPVKARRAVTTRAMASDPDEIALLEKMLELAKARKEQEEAAPAAASSSEGYDGKGFTIKTFNAISPVGLNKYPKGQYIVSGDDAALPDPPMGVMLRSHKLQLDDVPHRPRHRSLRRRYQQHPRQGDDRARYPRVQHPRRQRQRREGARRVRSSPRVPRYRRG